MRRQNSKARRILGSAAVPQDAFYLVTVQFATMHHPKGLEFDHVVVVAPQAFLGDPLETEYQRKLIYVALTRAKREAVMLKL